jgi:hypothetical protein
MLAGRAVSLEVRLVHIPSLARHEGIAQRLQRHVRIAPGPVSEGTLQKIWFVNGPQTPCDGALPQPILHGRDAEGPHCAMALGDLDPPYWRCLVLTGSEPLPKRVKALIEVCFERRDRLPLEPACALAVELPPRVSSKLGRQQVCQSRAAALRIRLRFCGALPSLC